MDLSKQKTFIENSMIKSWCSDDNFIISYYFEKLHLFFLDESYDHLRIICEITSLEHLEKEYNKRSNDVFEWK